MSTPGRDGAAPTTPPKTPGWTGALFGRFSSKKARVESPSAAADASSRSMPNPSRRTPRHEFSLPNGTPSAAAASSPWQDSTSTMTNGTGAAAASKSAAFLSPMREGRTAPPPPSIKSPWKSPARPTTGKRSVVFALGTSTPSTGGALGRRKKTPYKKRHLPKVPPPIKRRPGPTNIRSRLLVRSNRLRPDDAQVDRKILVNALEKSKGLFASLAASNRIANPNMPKIIMGARQFGSNQSGSRLAGVTPDVQFAGTVSFAPGISDGMDASASANAPAPQGERKVSFQDQSSTSYFSTPQAKGSGQRTATPYRPFSQDNYGDDSVTSPTLSITSTQSRSPSKQTTARMDAASLELQGFEEDFTQEETILTDSNGNFIDAAGSFSIPMGDLEIRAVPVRDYSTYAKKQDVLTRKIEKKSSEARDELDKERDTKKTRKELWTCAICGTENADDETRCTKVGCDGGRPVPKGGFIGWGSMFKDQKRNKWQCPSCSVLNDNSLNKCASCDFARPGAAQAAADAPSASKLSPTGFSFPANASATETAAATSSVSGAVGNSAPGSIGCGGFSFPMAAAAPSSDSKAPAPGSTANGNAAPSPTKGFFFGTTTPGGNTAPSTSQGFSLGATTPGSTGFKFQPTTLSTEAKTSSGEDKALANPFGATPSSSTSSTGFVFGASSAKSPSTQSAGSQKSGSEQAKPVFSFSAPKSEPAPAPSPVPAPEKTDVDVSGSESKKKRRSTESTFGTSSSAKTQSSTVAPAPSAPVPAFNFGSKTEAADTSKPAASASGPSFKFGSAPTPASGEEKKKAAPFQFGTSSSIQLSAPAGDADKSNAFGGSSFGSTPSNPTPKEAPLFGSSATPAKIDKPAGEAKTPAPLFGNNSSAGSGFTFGNSTSAPAATTQAAKPFSFGTSAPTPAPAPTSSVPAFGSAAPVATPSISFGSQPPAPAIQFGSTPAPATPAPAFGAAPAFGNASTPAAPGFGTAASTPAAPAFGTAASTPAAPTFGSAAPPTTFGAPSAPANNPFGGTPATTFGGPPTTPASFGAAPPASTTGMFGAPASTTNPAPSTGFSFGSPAPTTPAPSGGFGTAPHTAPPANFGGNGMTTPAGTGAIQFNLGTGGTSKTPGRRRVIRAKRPGSMPRPA